MSIFEAVLLGLVQGLAEFLPVSSSGHLALLQHFFGIEGENVLAFAVLLHVGTLVSVFIVYWNDIYHLFIELGSVTRDIFTGKGLRMNLNPTRKLGIMIIVATIPTALIGLLFKDVFAAMYLSLMAIGVGLLVTGTVLWLSERLVKGTKQIGEMKFIHAVLIGICQSIAISPGVSRSGATLVGGLFSGLDRNLAVKFAFLISIPSILGSVIIEAPDAFRGGISMDLAFPIIIGVIVAAVSGFFAIKTMIKVVSNKKLYYFSFYTWALGTIVIAYTIFMG
ncbi:MAG: undecaprenyl-diphosphate phosphatase [Peptostreptococcaceae bacterium]|nr:undecaprenyl-diphosphate phosphatase [Peptostreptococcaceae bacterium]